MTLYDLQKVIQYDTDICDDEVDARVYIDIKSMHKDIAKEIEIVSIYHDVIIVKISDYLRKHRKSTNAYLEEYYYEGEQKDTLLKYLVKYPDILSDGGYAVAHFIINDLNDYCEWYKEQVKGVQGL